MQALFSNKTKLFSATLKEIHHEEHEEHEALLRNPGFRNIRQD